MRVLQIVTYMGIGGLETLLMNCYRHMDREQVQFDFLVHREFRADYDDEIEALGGRIYRLPRLNPFSPGYYRQLNAFFREHPEYRVVHCHLDCMSGIPLQAAKKHGVPVRIAHSHNNNQDKNLKYLLKRYYMRKIPKAATHFFACSQDAGRWMFPGQAFSVVANGIDTEKFAFRPEIRDRVRQELGVEGKLVLGHVGRFAPQKNHRFLVELFAAVHEKNPDTVLLLAGEGPLEQEIRNQVRTLGLSDSVRFLGLRRDTERLYQAMDVFLLPSHHEGLPVVTAEAQAAGLPCLLSDGVPRAAALTDLVQHLPAVNAESWAEQILKIETGKRSDGSARVCAAGYDIRTTAKKLQNFYREAEQYGTAVFDDHYTDL